MALIGFVIMFFFLLMAFWCLLFVFITVKGWAMLGAREIFVKKFGHKLGMEPNFPSTEEEEK